MLLGGFILNLFLMIGIIVIVVMFYIHRIKGLKMIQHTIFHNYFIKSLLCIILLLCGSVYSMDDPIQEFFVEKSPFFLIPVDVINTHLKQKVEYQGIGRIKQVNKACNASWKVDNICVAPLGCASKCSVPACRKLVGNYNACSKALSYYAHKGNRRMFGHLWRYNHRKRNELVAEMIHLEKPLWRDRMDVYRGNFFDETEKMILRSERLAHAMVRKDHEVVRFITLCNEKFDVCCGVNYHTSLLKCACNYGDMDILLHVLGGVGHINDTDADGKSAIHYAWKSLLFSQLIFLGADIDQLDGSGTTLLFNAVEWGDMDVLRTVLTYKPDVNIADPAGRTVAHYAIAKYRDDVSYKIEILDLLLQAGIRVDQSSLSGITFLHHIPLIYQPVRRRAVKNLLKKHGIKREKTWSKFF